MHLYNCGSSTLPALAWNIRSVTLFSDFPSPLTGTGPSALARLAKDRMQDFQELADEAFADLLAKHGRPTDLKTALRRSVEDTGKKPPAASVTRGGGRKITPATTTGDL